VPRSRVEGREVHKLASALTLQAEMEQELPFSVDVPQKKKRYIPYSKTILFSSR
jgi:hypothetical protein